MALKYGIFESEFLGLDTNNMPMYDRAVDEEFLEQYIGGLFSNGIGMFIENCFQVVSELNNQITIKAGIALINGKMAYDRSDYEVGLPSSPTTTNRYDRVVLRRDNIAREIKIMFISGTENAAPVAPALVRTENVHDLCLATILRSPSDVVTQAKITDDRLNTSLCGLIAPKTNVLNTEALFSQFTTAFNETAADLDADVNNLKSGFQSIWDTWFTGIQNVLSGDTAGNLLNMINANTADILVHTTNIAALNNRIINQNRKLRIGGM